MSGYKPHRFSGSQAWRKRQDKWKRRLLNVLAVDARARENGEPEGGEGLTISEIRTMHKFPNLDASDSWLEKLLMALMKKGQVAQRISSDGIRWYLP